MAFIYNDFDISDFWNNTEYSIKEYVSDTVTEELIQSIEEELGYKLPKSYIELMKNQNGGTPKNCCFPTKESTSWAQDHIAISGILGIGKEKTYSLCGEFGSKFMIEEWEYPEIGIYICDCPSAGHDMICLDYRKNGKNGEPEVVHVDQELNYQITFLAENFEAFIRGLVNDSVYDRSEEIQKEELERIEKGSFSKLLQSLIQKENSLNFETIIRNICKKLTLEKKCFALHADELSYLMYDLQFYLYTQSYEVRKESKYWKKYPSIIALIYDGEFTTNGYAPSFVEEWMDTRKREGRIYNTPQDLLKFSDEYKKELLEKLSIYLIETTEYQEEC